MGDSLQRHVGLVALALILMGCPRYSRQPPPRGAVDTAGESAGVTLTSNANGARPAERVRGDGQRERVPTCISGVVATAASVAIPVARAKVTIVQGDTHRETMTDDNGRFTWCAPRLSDGVTVHASVHIEKAAFVAASRELELAVGTTAEVEIGLAPTQ